MSPFRSRKSIIVLAIATVIVYEIIQILFEPRNSGPAVFVGSAVIAYVLLVAIANFYGSSSSRTDSTGSCSGTDSKEEFASGSSRHESQQDRPRHEDRSAISYERACMELGISINSPVEEIKRAYREKAKQWHPDKLDGMAPELREIASERMKRINEAYEVLIAATATV